MADLELLSLALRGATLLVAAAALAVAVAALRTVRASIVAMTKNAAQRAAEHDKRHDEAMTALRALIARTGPAADRSGLDERQGTPAD